VVNQIVYDDRIFPLVVGVFHRHDDSRLHLAIPNQMVVFNVHCATAVPVNLVGSIAMRYIDDLVWRIAALVVAVWQLDAKGRADAVHVRIADIGKRAGLGDGELVQIAEVRAARLLLDINQHEYRAVSVPAAVGVEIGRRGI
jgi:hypothetical protein